MDTFVVSIGTDNDAFANAPGIELARILRSLADCIDGADVATVIAYDAFGLRDVNGNTVGSVAVL